MHPFGTHTSSLNLQQEPSLQNHQRPVTSFHPKNLNKAVQYFAEYKIQPALKSFVDGLSNCGFLEAVKQHPSVFKPFFIPAPAPSTKKEFLEIFHYQRSRVGGNKFDVESKVISFFGSFLKDCEEGIAASTEIGHVSIPELLHFATGMGRQPPGGFPSQPSIKFNHDKPDIFCLEANTCLLVLTLPVAHDTKEEFKYFCSYSIKNTVGFGQT